MQVIFGIHVEPKVAFNTTTIPTQDSGGSPFSWDQIGNNEEYGSIEHIYITYGCRDTACSQLKLGHRARELRPGARVQWASVNDFSSVIATILFFSFLAAENVNQRVGGLFIGFRKWSPWVTREERKERN